MVYVAVAQSPLRLKPAVVVQDTGAVNDEIDATASRSYLRSAVGHC